MSQLLETFVGSKFKLIFSKSSVTQIFQKNSDILETISVITNDGRNIVGVLKGFDQLTNVILSNSNERVYSINGIEQVFLGLYIIRGDNVAIVGEVNPELDKKIDFSSTKARPLKPVVH